MVILLMIVFAASISVLIVQGSRTYRTIIDNKNDEEHVRIAISYINMRIKQNDVAKSIYILPNHIEGKDALVIEHHGEEEGLSSYIFFYEGILYECYTDAEPTLMMSSEIIPLRGITFGKKADKNMLIVTIDYNYGGNAIAIENYIALRTD